MNNFISALVTWMRLLIIRAIVGSLAETATVVVLN